MTQTPLLSYWPVDGVLKRRGRTDIVSNYREFAVGELKPLGYKDEAAGLGTRNVGPRLASLTVHVGDITLTPGMVVSGLDIQGRLIGRGDSTTLVTDCIVRGRNPALAGTNDAAVVGTSYNFGGVVIQWTRIENTSNQGFSDCINGGGFTLKYCELYGGVDGFGANAIGSASMICCRVAYGYYDSWWDTANGKVRTAAYTDAGGVYHSGPFPSQSSGDVHSDGASPVQYPGWYIGGCYIGGDRTSSAGIHLDPTISADYAEIIKKRTAPDFANAAIFMSSASSSALVGATIEKNWLQGGAARFNMTTNTWDDMAGVKILNNRFIRSSYGYYLYVKSTANPYISPTSRINDASPTNSNVFDDTGTPVTITRF